MKITFDESKLYPEDKKEDSSPIKIFYNFSTVDYQISPNQNDYSNLLSGSSFIQELEDYFDLIDARQALAESDELIPYEVVRRELGLAD